MPSLNTASRWLDSKLDATQAETVRIWRGSDYVDVEATWSSTPIGFALSGQVTQSWQTTDLLVPVEQLVLGGHAVEPERGMRIEATINGNTVWFVCAETDDKRSWRWADAATRKTYLIHMREAA